MDTPSINNDDSRTSSELKPTVLVIFGITGNLSQNKLLPALYKLLEHNRLPERFTIVGVFREGEMTVDSLLQQLEITLLRTQKECDSSLLQRIKEAIQPITMDSTNINDFYRLRDQLVDIDHQHQTAHQRLFYLAIPPSIFLSVIECLGESGLNQEVDASRRIFVEKPFGLDLESAQHLVNCISRYFAEHQIYRIDHYLAKETAQNILAFRFNNPIIEDLWGRQFIDHIQISAMQKGDIEGRVGFYEGMGALRDIVQSHLLQLMALIMMESPEKLDSENIHAEKLELLRSVQPIRARYIDEFSVRGQYAGYLDEVNNQTSTIETFVAVKLEASNSRWGGVPVLLRTGKALAQDLTEIHVVFKSRSRRRSLPNILTIRIQPNEGISLRLTQKKPGFTNELQPIEMNFNYRDAFKDGQPDAYERVLFDAISGDQSLFASSDEVIRSWEILDPLIQAWKNDNSQPARYEKGSDGPAEVTDLARLYGSEWI